VKQRESIIKVLRLIAEELKDNNLRSISNIQSAKKVSANLYLDHTRRIKSLSDDDFKDVMYILDYPDYTSQSTFKSEY
jgi:hypothetical protein